MQNKYTYLTQRVLLFLAVPPKFQRNSASNDRAQRDINQQVLCDIADIVLDLVIRFPEGEDINSADLWACSDGKMCHCWPIVVTSLADHKEHANLIVVM